MPSDLTLGAEYNYDGLEDEVIGYERYMKQKVRIAGTYPVSYTHLTLPTT